MQSPRSRAPGVAALALALVLTGCSKTTENAVGSQPLPPNGQPTADAGSGPIGLSPDGVTTRVNVPAQSTEEQYAQACLVAKEWMAGRGGDPHTLVEPYLKDVQSTSGSSRATFGKPWGELTDAQRAGVIIAVTAAADGGC
jgi:Putative lipoprotein LpqV